MIIAMSHPRECLWQGLYHPDASEAFATVADYLQWYGKRHEHCVGILFFRTYWANGDLAIVDSLIRELEKDVDVLPAFCFGWGTRTWEPNPAAKWWRSTSQEEWMRSSICSPSFMPEAKSSPSRL